MPNLLQRKSLRLLLKRKRKKRVPRNKHVICCPSSISKKILSKAYIYKKSTTNLSHLDSLSSSHQQCVNKQLLLTTTKKSFSRKISWNWFHEKTNLLLLPQPYNPRCKPNFMCTIFLYKCGPRLFLRVYLLSSQILEIFFPRFAKKKI